MSWPGWWLAGAWWKAQERNCSLLRHRVTESHGLGCVVELWYSGGALQKQFHSFCVKTVVLCELLATFCLEGLQSSPFSVFNTGADEA